MAEALLLKSPPRSLWQTAVLCEERSTQELTEPPEGTEMRKPTSASVIRPGLPVFLAGNRAYFREAGGQVACPLQ